MSARGARGDVAVPLTLLTGTVLIGSAVTIAALRLAVERPAAAPLVSVAALTGVVLVLRPTWTVPAFAALTWTAIDASLLGGLPSPVQWGGLVLAGAGAVRAARVPAIAAPPLAVVGLLAAPLVVSWLVAADRSGLDAVAPLRDLLFLLIGAWCVRGPDEVDRVLTAIVVAGLALGVGAVWSVAVGPTAVFPVVSEGPGLVRAAGPFGEPNFFALSLAATVPAGLALVGRGAARGTLGTAAVLAACAGILSAGSRGAAIAALVAIVLTVVTGGPRLRRAGLVLLVLGAALVPVFSAQLGGAEGRTVAGRATENTIALAMAADHPFVGVGPGGYPALYRDYGRRLGSDPRSNRAPHSLPLQIAAEQGAVGIVCWAAGLLLVVGALRRARGVRGARTIGLCLATYAVGSLFLHGSQLRLPYLLAGLAFALAASASGTGTGRTGPASGRTGSASGSGSGSRPASSGRRAATSRTAADAAGGPA